MTILRAVLDADFDSYLRMIRDFTDDELIPAETELATTGRVPPELLERMAELGLFGISIPRELGGLAWTMEQQVRLTFEFTRASCVYRSRFSTTIGLTSQVLLEQGTPQQINDLIPSFAAGRTVAAFALTEEAAGSDASAVETVAIAEDDGFRLSGSKRYITNRAWADVLLVFARHIEAGVDLGLSTFLVDTSATGFSATTPDRMNGHESGPVASLVFDDVRIPKTALVGRPGAGLRMALRGINHARTHVAATAVGQSARLIKEMTDHALRRKQFGAPLAELGAVEIMISTSWADMLAAQALTLECARKFDSGPIPRHEIGAAKYFATEAVGRIADRAVQILGGEGIVGNSPVPRMWRDVRALRIYEGSSQVHERNMARHIKDVVQRGESLWAL